MLPGTAPAKDRRMSGAAVCFRSALIAACYFGGLNVLLLATLAALGAPPWAALTALWAGALGDSQNPHLYRLSESLVETSPLLLAGLGTAVAWRAGLFSIGGQGQILVGALAALIVARLGPGAPLLTIPIAILAGGAAGGAWGAAAAWLRVRRNVHEVISTIMLNYVAIYLVEWLVGKNGPLQEKARNNLASDPIDRRLWLPHLLPRAWTGGIETRLHAGVLIALVAVVTVSLVMNRTATGFGWKVIGQNPAAARAAKYDVDRLRVQAMAASGLLCGVAGSLELLGVSYRLDTQFSSPGWGFTAIPVALLGGLEPTGTLLAALFFGALAAGSDNLEQTYSISGGIVNIVQAVAVLAVLALTARRAMVRKSKAAH